MAELESLSKEELLNLLKASSSKQTEQLVPTNAEHASSTVPSSTDGSQKEDKCRFRPLRSNQPNCTNEPVSLGFCKVHSKTVQYQRAKKEHDDAQIAAIQAAAEQQIQKAKEEAKESVPEQAEDEEEVKPTKNGRTLTQKKSQPKTEDDEPHHTDDNDDVLHNRNVETEPPKKETKPPNTRIGRNKWGRWEHVATGIVFDPQTRAAIGWQNNNDGKMYALTRKHIDICNSKGWKHIITKDSDSESSSSESEDSSSSSSSDEEESSHHRRSNSSSRRSHKHSSDRSSDEEERSSSSEDEEQTTPRPRRYPASDDERRKSDDSDEDDVPLPPRRRLPLPSAPSAPTISRPPISRQTQGLQRPKLNYNILERGLYD